MTATVPTPTGTVRVVAAGRAGARRRSVLVAAVLVAAVVVLAATTVTVGEVTVGVPDLLRLLVGAAPRRVEFVVGQLRAPRALAGLGVGAALGAGGAIVQRLLHNPLASPDVIGIGAGASAAAVLGVVVLRLSGAPVAVLALAGALGAAALVAVLAREHARGGQRFVLVGVGVNALLVSVVSWLLTSADVQTAEEALRWLTGSLTGIGWGSVLTLAVSLAVLGPAAVVLARALPGLSLGDDVAVGLGLPVARVRLALLVVAVALVGVATAVAGPVTFVGFVSGPVATRIVGGGRAALGHAALVGAVVVLGGDLVAAHLLGPVEMPVGVATGAVGAPYLIYLLVRAGRRAGGTP